MDLVTEFTHPERQRGVLGVAGLCNKTLQDHSTGQLTDSRSTNEGSI